ncbi:MAG TPA: hypothetical protein VF114_09205, partial [Candidatus Limnocylindria bacterium]
MTDEQLSRDMRALEVDEEPNPAFADALFAELEGEIVARHGPGATWFLLAAAALIAALAVGAALGSGLVRLPFLIADASPTASPSTSASATAVEMESAEPSPTASPEPSPTPVPGSLAVGGVARVIADGLTLRAEPGLQGVPFGTVTTDQVGFIVDGPM